ncbi:MAG: hypothetical protein KIT84_36750 [Labilithrix sp.]|nr:hypothetical protein [Labilithrix sp.]MCW5816606.1 hypothetical protein [Labilithrix sp.]
MRLRSLSTVPLLLVVATTAGEAAAKPGDPADRGLDLFVHAPKRVYAGDSATLDLLAYGFVTVTDARPLDRAGVIATWDPESLGEGVTTAPGEISATTDGQGRATIKVPVPEGGAHKLTLLVALRHGEHVRTRKVQIDRLPRHAVRVQVPDPSVVPGSRVPAWVTVTDTRTGAPTRGASVDVALLESDLVRVLDRVTTDASGIARATLMIPKSAKAGAGFSIRGRLAVANGGHVEQKVALSLREERPATPSLRARWTELQLKPGEIGHATIDLLDATGEPIANHPLLYWVGPRGTSPPKTDEDWKSLGKPATTNGLGHVDVTAQAPRVVTALGSSLTVVVRTTLEDQSRDAHDSVNVGLPVAEASLEVENGELVPGAKQRAFLHVSDGEDGVAGEFSLEGDGLRAKVTTDAHGDAEVTWPVPEDVGAKRDVGPCAGGVAAAVTVRQTTPIPALARHPEPFQLCVAVDRERHAVLRSSMYVARVGDKPKLTVDGGKRAPRGAGSVTVTSPAGTGTATWSGSEDAVLDLSGATPGLHDVTLAVPRANAPTDTMHTRVLVVPSVLPRTTAKIASGKLLPGADVDVDVTLDDGHGKPLAGAITAVVIDKEGGGSIRGLEAIDTRWRLCGDANVARERCDEFLEGGATAETLRRAALATSSPKPLAPELDPAAHAKGQLKETFSEVLHSLEGAVFQAETPESQRDVRRKENGRWTFNPELMTLVTAAMTEEPTTPGGDPFKLGDLIAVDAQVSFDAVARRVTRLKLFNVLVAIRNFLNQENLTPDEPILRDPNGIIRRLVREGQLSKEMLIDPWGGTIQLVKGGGGLPFLTVARGWELHSPGPDGVLGSGDDVKDPFERVVRSGTPYAEAMGEDEIVDARLDMRVGEATVSSWQAMFDRLTGKHIGSIGSGSGTGQGFGSGHGRLGGSHVAKAPQVRMGQSIVTETARWTEPVRVDDKGHARVRVRLGDYETTWQIALLARTDAGQTAVTSVDAPAFLPLSAHVDVGRRLHLKDAVAGRVVVRNRTPQATKVALDLAAEGGLALAPGQAASLSLDVPANAVRSAFVRYVAKAEGTGRASVVMRGPGIAGDRSVTEVPIEPQGESLVISNGVEVPKRGRLHVPLPPGWELRGDARVVLESGLEGALVSALESFAPEPSTAPDALADAIEVAARVEKIAESRSNKALVLRARERAALARTYLSISSSDASPRIRAAFARSSLYPPPPDPSRPAARKDRGAEAACPKQADVDALPVALLLETEPAPTGDGPPSCFTQLTAKTTSKEPLDLARAALALADRPHRAALAQNLTRELARVTSADDTRAPIFDGTRAERAIVLAALARTPNAWAKDDAAGRRIAEALLTLRDARGGYGSAEATRDVVRAFVALESAFPAQASQVALWEKGKRRHSVALPARGAATVPFDARTQTVEIEVTGAPVIARLERPVLRSWLAATDNAVTPVAVAIEWPADTRAGSTGVVHVAYTGRAGHDMKVETRLPLPPGVELAGTVAGVSLRQGVLYISTTVRGNETVALPVRFTLPGLILVPEAETQTTSEEQPRTLSPARWLTVQ